MNPVADTLEREYAAAMLDFLAGRGEAALRRAYEAGRGALAGGLGVLELLAAHEKALAAAVNGLEEPRREHAIRRALCCFAESLSPFEMVLRGVRESNTRLNESVASLQQARDEVEQERRRYRALFDFAPDAYLVTAPDDTIREANAAAAALLGVPGETLSGCSLAEFIMPAEREAFAAALGKLREREACRIDDLHLWVIPRGAPAFAAALTAAAENSDEPAVRWLIRDVTGRKRMERQRTRSLVDTARARAARRFQFLSEASSLLVGSLDVDANLASVARLALPYLAEWCFVNVVDTQGALRQTSAAYLEPCALAARLERHCLFGRGHAPDSAATIAEITPEWCERAADGPEHFLALRELCGRSAMVLPMRIRDRALGVLTFVSAPGGGRYRSSELALGEDLARRCALALENARLYRDVIAERDKAERANRAKDEFLAILSHELRNPLMPVVGWTRMLKNHALIAQDPVLAEGVRSMERNAQTLERLVADCLDLARISEGKIQMERKPVDLNQIILASIHAVRETAGAKNLSIIPEILVGSVLVFGDETRLEQVVMNLLVNAVKYTERGGLIRVGCSLRDSEAEIEVTDTGTGIHPAFLEQIFQPFRRGSGAWIARQSGLGLGLTIARQIVEMHSGRIWAESRGLDAGSTFRVRLPMAAMGAIESVRGTEIIPGEEHGANVRILLIEDSEDILFLLKIELEMQGHAIYTALDGESGLELAQTHLPDLIISDIKMPGMNGYELIRAVRECEELRGIPAIALTGFGGKTEFERALEAGFDACIGKPSEPHEISALIKKLTEKKTANQA